MLTASLALQFQLAVAAALPMQHEHGTRAPLPSAEEIAKLPPDGGDEFNRLVFSKSPYLLQHARNPVDWHEWGPEAFALAKERGVPVFLSIGYSTCHWCHVMEHESFEDDAVAKLMNEAFVCIKLDREERPDIDQLYMTVTQAMTGSGGWPMTVVMTDDKRPFFAGTYFPKASRGGRMGMLELVPAISKAWGEQREEVVASADRITAQLRTFSTGNPGAALAADTLESGEELLRQRFDAEHGGFGNSRKFPVPHELRFLLRRYQATGDESTLAMVTKTLEAWRLGGIFDHVGLGIHRYSTDREFLVPHFEKMLYDQALCAMAYVDAWLVTKDPAYERAAREILAYVTRDMTSPGGGFYSAEDADSEGEEGLFYLWRTSEVEAVLEDDAPWVIERFGMKVEGNYLDESTRRRTGRNIPHLDTPLTDDERAKWEPLRRKLFESREARIHPLKDDKVLTDWNGLAIEAFARAGRAFGDDALVDTARRGARFLRANLVREDGRLHKRWRNGEAGLDGMLEDYAYVASAFLALFEVTHDPADLAFARQVTDLAVAHFHDEEGGGFFLSPDDGEALIVRAKEVYDGARPSGNSVMAGVLGRLAHLTGEMGYEELSDRTIRAFAGAARQNPAAHTQLLAAADAVVRGMREIVVVGDEDDEEVAAILATLGRRFAPNDVLILRPPGDAEDEPVAKLVAAAPWVAFQTQLEGRATAYVCVYSACKAPVTGLEALLEVLESAPQPPAEGADAEGGK